MSFPRSVNGLPFQGSPLSLRQEYAQRTRKEAFHRRFSIAHPLVAQPKLILESDSPMRRMRFCRGSRPDGWAAKFARAQSCGQRGKQQTYEKRNFTT